MSQEEFSDDEIFFGKLSLKEVKKRVFWNNFRQENTYNGFECKPDVNSSLKLIETHSQPNLRCIKEEESPTFSSQPGSPAIRGKQSEDSFIKMEDMVSKLCMSPRKSDNLELNNTLEVIEYILNNGPKEKADIKTENNVEVKIEVETGIEEFTSVDSPQVKISPIKVLTQKQESPRKKIEKINSEDSPDYRTPAKGVKKPQGDAFVTPLSVNVKAKAAYKTPQNKVTPFKTPGNPLSHKKPSTTSLKTPGKTNAYQHITSPIASYIKNCPQVPLVKNVVPRKPLPGTSSIPKFVRNPQSKSQNKENVNLPSLAYKSAKKTKVIEVPDEDKLPQSQWAKKVLPQATVMRHENREMNFIRKPLMTPQEDSFANLSYHQAEVSVCTQKTAFKSTKHNNT